MSATPKQGPGWYLVWASSPNSPIQVLRPHFWNGRMWLTGDTILTVSYPMTSQEADRFFDPPEEVQSQEEGFATIP